jgi:hypothetical protein
VIGFESAYHERDDQVGRAGDRFAPVHGGRNRSAELALLDDFLHDFLGALQPLGINVHELYVTIFQYRIRKYIHYYFPDELRAPTTNERYFPLIHFHLRTALARFPALAQYCLYPTGASTLSHANYTRMQQPAV